MPLTRLGTYMRADIKIILNKNREALKKFQDDILSKSNGAFWWNILEEVRIYIEIYSYCYRSGERSAWKKAEASSSRPPLQTLNIVYFVSPTLLILL